MGKIDLNKTKITFGNSDIEAEVLGFELSLDRDSVEMVNPYISETLELEMSFGTMRVYNCHGRDCKEEVNWGVHLEIKEAGKDISVIDTHLILCDSHYHQLLKWVEDKNYKEIYNLLFNKEHKNE